MREAIMFGFALAHHDLGLRGILRATEVLAGTVALFLAAFTEQTAAVWAGILTIFGLTGVNIYSQIRDAKFKADMREAEARKGEWETRYREEVSDHEETRAKLKAELADHALTRQQVRQCEERYLKLTDQYNRLLISRGGGGSPPRGGPDLDGPNPGSSPSSEPRSA